MDLGLLFGIIGTWLIIVWTLLLGGSLNLYIDLPSVVLVVGGSFTVMLFAFPFGNIRKLVSVARKAVFARQLPMEKLIGDMVSYAEIARRDGILSLENSTKDIDDPFIVQGIQMAVDGTDPELIEQVMSSELDNVAERHDMGKALFDALGKYAPAMGMMGTVIGLVAMLSDLSDPSKVGAGMAVALITTLYGSFIANAIALPLADRLARRSAEEILYKTIIIKAVMSIQAGDNPRVVEQKLRTFLPPSARPAMEEAA